jgi:hypothetical protein
VGGEQNNRSVIHADGFDRRTLHADGFDQRTLHADGFDRRTLHDRDSMTTVYVGQNSLRIDLDTGVDISTALSVLIKYIKPDGITGQWTATASTTKARVDLVTTSQLDVAGVWTVWAFVTFSDGRVAPGSPVQFIVRNAGLVP